ENGEWLRDSKGSCRVFFVGPSCKNRRFLERPDSKLYFALWFPKTADSYKSPRHSALPRLLSRSRLPRRQTPHVVPFRADGKLANPDLDDATWANVAKPGYAWARH